MDTVREASKRRKLRKCKIYQEAPGFNGNMDEEYFKRKDTREGACLRERAIIVLEKARIQKLLESCSGP